MSHRFLPALLCAAFLFAGTTLSAQTSKPAKKSGANPVLIMKTSMGDIEIELFEKSAPLAVANFIALAEGTKEFTDAKTKMKVTRPFFDGLKFHRCIDKFMIQGGCPKGDGTGGPGWTVDAEFNEREHHPGVLSMARSADPDSAGSQFFVCLTREHCQHLDNQYTGFGKVTNGMDAVNKIAEKGGGTITKAEAVK